MDYFVGTRPNSFAEFVLPPTWRALDGARNRLTRRGSRMRARRQQSLRSRDRNRGTQDGEARAKDPPLETKFRTPPSRSLIESSTLRPLERTLTRRRK